MKEVLLSFKIIKTSLLFHEHIIGSQPVDADLDRMQGTSGRGTGEGTAGFEMFLIRWFGEKTNWSVHINICVSIFMSFKFHILWKNEAFCYLKMERVKMYCHPF